MTPTLQQECDSAYELAKAGEYERALRVCHDLVINNPNRLEPIRTRAAVCMHRGDYGAAETDLLVLAKRGSAEPSDYYDLGRACFQLKKYRAAVEALSRAVQAGEQAHFKYYEKACLLLRAEARFRINDTNGAMKDCREVGTEYVGYVPGVGAKTAGDILLAIEKKSAT